SVHSEADAELAVDQPISILYGTESGNAELVAEELAEFLSAQPDLEVKNLSIAFPAQHGDVNIVDDVSFSVRPGETMGLVGESGCG
nr:hypothetical protein [Streptococcus anginosus]